MPNEENLQISVDITHFNHVPTSLDRNSFANILYINARSLRNSLMDIQDYIDCQNFSIHVIVIVETWITQNEAEYFNLLPYKSFHSHRRLGRGGGVAIFVHENFDNPSILFEEDYYNNNFLIINLPQQKLKIAGIYRQPGNINDPTAHTFISHLEKLLSKYSHMIVLGDFNINLFETSETTLNYQNAYSLNGYTLLNNLSSNFATRINHANNTSTCLDHIISDLHFSNYNFQHNFFCLI